MLILRVLVQSLFGKDVTFIAAGPYNSAFVTSDGELFVAGANDSSQLGVKASQLPGGGE
ncbi:RCC1/BLIP-II, partial [Haematococcus lacustris]